VLKSDVRSISCAAPRLISQSSVDRSVYHRLPAAVVAAAAVNPRALGVDRPPAQQQQPEALRRILGETLCGKTVRARLLDPEVG
jgi:hypothetical protein